MKYNLIIFDLGNVVVNFDHGISARKVAAHSRRSIDDIYNLFFDSPITQMHDEGRLSSKDFFRKINKHLNIKMDFKKFTRYWNNIFFRNKEMERLVKKLKKRKFKIYLMSNTNKLHFDFIKSKFGIIKYFDKIILSYKIGVRKPDPKIYRHALKLAGATPEKTIYVDDRADLIEAARMIGITAILFKNAAQLKRDLTKLFVDTKFHL